MSQRSEKTTDAATDAMRLNQLPIFAGVLTLLLIISYALIFRELPANANPAAWGAFGDYMGGLLNPLISLFTLMVAMKVWGLQKTKLWKNASIVLDHYFRAIFSIRREAEPTLKEDCWRYTKLLRAQLSRVEVNLVAMNLLYDEEGIKMRDLVARYGMLKHMPANPLRTTAERELAPSSFGRKWALKHMASEFEEPHAD